MLERAQAPFDYVNIAEDAESRGKVMAINDGNASVPTLVFPDGSTLTEPSTAVLRQKLESLGLQSTQAEPVAVAAGQSVLQHHGHGHVFVWSVRWQLGLYGPGVGDAGVCGDEQPAVR
jgi:mycoredoxin